MECWGSGYLGTAGATGPVQRLEAGTVKGVTDATAVTMAGGAACALIAGGAVECWGSNTYGQLGDGTTTDRAVPSPVPGVSSAVQIAVGATHACAVLSNASVRCWGSGRGYELGNFLPLDSPTPVVVIGAPPATLITAGGETNLGGVPEGFTCILSTDGTEWCWGKSLQKPATSDPKVPQRTGPADIVDITGPFAVLDDGQIQCASYGGGPWTELVGPGGNVDVVHPAFGGGPTCVLHDDGTAACRDSNSGGQLGNGFGSFVATPRTPVDLGTPGTELAAGSHHTCTRLSSGAVSCWGNGFLGQLGDGTTTSSTTPVDVVGMADSVSVVSGFNHTCAVRAADTVQCWGRNDSGELGDGTTTSSTTPVDVVGLSDVASLSAGFGSTCAVRGDGSVWCWGNGSNGIGPAWSPDLSLPAPVPGLSGVVDSTGPAGGVSPLCVVLNDSSVRCLGSNSLYGLLGNGTVSSSGGPVEPIGLSPATAVDAGDGHICALASGPAGTVQCWGYDVDNQLGDGGPRNQADFGPVLGLP